MSCEEAPIRNLYRPPDGLQEASLCQSSETKTRTLRVFQWAAEQIRFKYFLEVFEYMKSHPIHLKSAPNQVNPSKPAPSGGGRVPPKTPMVGCFCLGGLGIFGCGWTYAPKNNGFHRPGSAPGWGWYQDPPTTGGFWKLLHQNHQKPPVGGSWYVKGKAPRKLEENHWKSLVIMT